MALLTGKLYADPPGVVYTPQLRQQLEAGLQVLGPGYQPRTEHLSDNGRPLFINRLILEDSPYLRQHAHNPVDWQSWGPEAFEMARREGKPVFLSIGYSTCHWCHVMEGIQNGATDSAFDVDENGVVDINDISAWLSIAGNANIGTPYVRGDTNLDGDVDAGDLNVIGINWRQDVAGWSQADFNADGIVSASDLDEIGRNWQHGVAAAASAGRVPRAPLAAQIDAAHAVPADAVIPAEITTPETQRTPRTESVISQIATGSNDRDETRLSARFRTTTDSHRLVSGQQDDSEQKDVFTDLADDIFAAW